MKSCILALLLFALASCGATPQVVIPANVDLKTDVSFKRGPDARTIEVTFYFSNPVAPGEKTEPTLEVIPVEEARFNGELLTRSTNEAGRPIYTAENLEVGLENLISARLNGRLYEGKILPQTTLPTRSASAVMTPK